MASCYEPHNHECPGCSAVWHHDPRTIPMGMIDEAHTCPKCGTQQFYVADDELVPTFCANGVRTLEINAEPTYGLERRTHHGRGLAELVQYLRQYREFSR